MPQILFRPLQQLLRIRQRRPPQKSKRHMALPHHEKTHRPIRFERRYPPRIHRLRARAHRLLHQPTQPFRHFNQLRPLLLHIIINPLPRQSGPILFLFPAVPIFPLSLSHSIIRIRLFAMPDTSSSTAPSLPDAPALPRSSELPDGVIARILPTASLPFVCYLTIGIPLAILPMHVHLRLGYGTVLAGLVISAQYVATVLSRPRVGRMVDVLGPKRIAVFGLFACAASGALTFAAAFFNSFAFACLVILLLGRLLLGIGESMVGTGAIMWGIGRAA